MRIFVTLLCFLLLLSSCTCRYTLRIIAVQYHNPDNEDWDGGCCDPSFFFCDTCDVYFFFCIRNKDLSPSNSDNCWDSVRSFNDITAGIVNFPISGELYGGAGLHNPITFNRNEAWPGSVQVLVTTWDSDGNADDLIDRNAYNLDLSPNGQWSGDIYANGFYDRAQFKIRVQLYCQSNYYSSNCNVYCVPHNDNTNGHYTCGSNGERVCNTGYTNPSTYCRTAICSSGCSSQNGYCNAPGECLCNSGWTGSNCNECIPRSGCSSSHGSCNQPNECNCETGYGGSLCTEDHDVCGHRQPCLHGATCTNVIPDSYRCTCSAGYTGTDCGTNINECDPNPCQNGGSCTDQVNGYVCTCATGWTGSQCLTNIDDCASGPCQNNGMCHDLVNSYNCTCSSGFIGPNCEGHHCDSTPCTNGGTCVRVQNGTGYTCVCSSGYTGVNCSQEIDECDPNPCQYNGTCTDLLADYRCTCPPGFTGKNCHVNIDECIGGNCGPHSVCLDGINGYTCICDTGYTGRFCLTEIDYCSPPPCLNNATCNSYPGYYTCNCQDGFNGTQCETNIDDCTPNACMNGGNCTDIVRGFICNCPTAFTGLICNTTVSSCDPNPCPSPFECVDNSSSASLGYYCEFCLENVCEILNQSQPVTDSPTLAPVSGDDNDHWGPYLGSALGGALLLCLLVSLIICCCCYCRRRRNKRTEAVSYEGNEEFTNNPTYIAPELLSSTLQRSSSPQYGTTAPSTYDRVLTNPLYAKNRRPSSPRKDGYEPLESVNSTEETGKRETEFRSSMLFSGVYDQLKAEGNENEYSYDPTQDYATVTKLTTAKPADNSTYKVGLNEEDTFPSLKGSDSYNPYETIPPNSPQWTTPYEAIDTDTTYETIPAAHVYQQLPLHEDNTENNF